MGATVASAVTYTWTGADGDGNWSNTLNWAGGILPVDDTPGAGNSEGVSLPSEDIIEFTGTNMPTNNLPGIGGIYYSDETDTGNTPRMNFNSGGAFDLAVKGQEDNIWSNWSNTTERVIFTIGDGVGGGTEDVVVNWTGGPQISRHGNSLFRYIINSDGTLNRTGSFDFSRNATRPTIMTVNGGTVVVSGTTYDLKAQAGALINFSALGSSYQSAWGGEFNTVPDVEDSIGVDFVNTSGIAGSELIASSVGGGWKVELLSSNEVANLYTTYTWTGSVDGNWSNAANWDANGIPVDDTPDTETNYFGITMPYKDSIVFDGSIMPTSNVPLIGNWYDASSVQGDTPTMVFNSGGEITLDVTSGQFAAFLTNPANDTRSVLTVGDGVGGGTEDVIVNVLVGAEGKNNGSFNRHNNGTHDYLVKSDGTLIIENPSTNVVDLSYNTTSRIVTFTIEGGAVVINDAVNDLSGNCNVAFTTAGGTFTAQYGGQFADITDVWSGLGTSFVDNTGNTLGTLQAVDVDGTNFTVSVADTSVKWASAQGISGDADVSTDGTLEYAYNCGTSSDVTLNGVLFSGTGSSTADFGGNVSLTSFTGTTTGYGTVFEPPFNALSAGYQTFLESAITNGAAISSVTLNNLTVGKRYQVQVWVNDSSTSNTNAQDVILSAGTADATTLDCANPDGEGGVGEYALGTFVADATSQSFALAGNRLQLNGIQVRQVNDINVGYWTGTGGATWDAATTANFAINKLDEALNVTTFDVAKAVNGTVTFADAYFDNETPIAVTNSSITITGTVEADEVHFVNDAVDYTLSGGAIGGASAVDVSGGGSLTINAAQTFSGGMTISEGSVVTIANGDRLGTTVVTLNGGEITAPVNANLPISGGPTNIVLGANGGTLRNANGKALYALESLVVSGDGRMTYAGNGNWGGNNRIQPNGTHTYTGGTLLTDTVNLLAYSDASFGAAGTKITIDNGRYMAWNDVNLGTREIEIASGGAQMALDYENTTIEGPITGTGALEINGQNRNGNSGAPGGQLFIKSADNTLSGPVTVDNATVQMNGNNALGTGALTLSTSNTNGVTTRLKNNGNGTTPVLDNAVTIGTGGAELMAGWNQSLTLAGDLSGSGDLTIVHDSGTVYLTGDGSSYTGTITVEGGNNPSNDVTTLAVAGDLGGTLNVLSNSVLVVGPAGPVSISVAGNMTLAATSTIEMEANGTSSDSIAVGGDLDISGATLMLTSTNLTGSGVTLASVTGTITGEFAGYPDGTEIEPGFTLLYQANSIVIAPEGPYESPTVESSISGGVVTLTWPSSIHAGDQFNVMTNVDLVNGTWGVDPTFVVFEDGAVYKATNDVSSAPQVFYRLEYP
ncbi:beta strand repeat-containing protein [Pontiella sp.]|uniref:beta strand repeat-containing protein n=1 Tax=Pontiella sp. TaxID=2837462 RepID=UPI0035691E31